MNSSDCEISTLPINTLPLDPRADPIALHILGDRLHQMNDKELSRVYSFIRGSQKYQRMSLNSQASTPAASFIRSQAVTPNASFVKSRAVTPNASFVISQVL
jgi:hypothetical protein